LQSYCQKRVSVDQSVGKKETNAKPDNLLRMKAQIRWCLYLDGKNITQQNVQTRNVDI